MPSLRTTYMKKREYLIMEGIPGIPNLTVEFKDSNGNHVTTKHIVRNGNTC
ncbi:hypothetical protein QBC36DRAFT_239778, partial [Triangularia setosa]